jgi:hypothetical protein
VSTILKNVIGCLLAELKQEFSLAVFAAKESLQLKYDDQIKKKFSRTFLRVSE